MPEDANLKKFSVRLPIEDYQKVERIAKKTGNICSCSRQTICPPQAS